MIVIGVNTTPEQIELAKKLDYDMKKIMTKIKEDGKPKPLNNDGP